MEDKVGRGLENNIILGVLIGAVAFMAMADRHTNYVASPQPVRPPLVQQDPPFPQPIEGAFIFTRRREEFGDLSEVQPDGNTPEGNSQNHPLQPSRAGKMRQYGSASFG